MDIFCNCEELSWVFFGGSAKIYPNLSDGAKKYQQVFLAPLPGMDSISILGDCAKKCQQAFLAPLPGKAYV
jgi:hypothetical protein